LIFVSGCVGVDPKTGKVVSPGEIAPQTKQTLENIQAILEAGGSSLDNVVKTTAFIDEMNKFAEFNEVYCRFFKETAYPARSAVQVGKFLKGICVEIEAVAIIPDGNGD